MDMEPTHPGRPRSFDKETVLDRMIPVFFENGFGGTSFPLLEAATGLHRQSIRYAFGDKRNLFQSSLKRYGENKLEEIRTILNGRQRAIDGIRGVFEMWVRDIRRETCRGCFLVATSSDRTLSTDTDLLETISQTNRRIVALLEDHFRTARIEGDVTSDLTDRQLAEQMLTVGDGAMALCQLPEARDSAAAIFEGFCAQIRS